MAGLGQLPPFTNDEKNYMLAEVIKQRAPEFPILLDLCTRLNCTPRFEGLALPPGRSLDSCIAVYNEMVQEARRAYTHAAPSPMSAVPTVRRAPGEVRPIAPRISSYTPPVNLNEAPLKRKRGRPSKLDQKARAGQLAESTIVAESSSMAAARLQTPQSVPPSPNVDARPATNPLSSTARMHISQMMTTPAPPPESASHSSSSSGKRRRRRRSGERPEDSASLHSYAPPYATTSFEDTPARSAGGRRDEAAYPSVAGLRVSEPEQSAGAQASAPLRPPSYGGDPS